MRYADGLRGGSMSAGSEDGCAVLAVAAAVAPVANTIAASSVLLKVLWGYKRR